MTETIILLHKKPPLTVPHKLVIIFQVTINVIVSIRFSYLQSVHFTGWQHSLLAMQSPALARVRVSQSVHVFIRQRTGIWHHRDT